MLSDQIIKIHSPATVANMVCGFDVLGFAVHDPYDEMQIRFTGKPGVTIINKDAYNGVTLIRSIHPLDIVPLQAPPLYVTIVHPQIEVRTADARSILKQQVQLKDAIRQWGNIAGLVAGLLQNDYDLIGRSLEDVLVEPVRSILIPGFDTIKQQSKEAGALGGGISGSGPSIFMLSRNEATAKIVEKQMQDVYQQLSLDHHTYVTTINKDGVKFIHQ